MTRDEKIARARELRTEGMSYQLIGDQFGVSHSCVMRWLDPERFRARDRAENVNRRAAKLAWQRAHDRSPQGRGVCPDCGDPMGVGAVHKGVERCAACVTRRKVANWERIEVLWADGRPLREIAADMGWSQGHLNKQIHRMRAAGRNVPYRYNVRPRVAA